VAADSVIGWETVILNETDRVIKDITWKVEIYDPMRQVKVDQFYTLTWRSGFNDYEELCIIPGEQKNITVMFYDIERFIWRKDYRLNVSIAKYTSSPYDPDRDKPSDFAVMDGETP
jgi:hypothetical protein